MCISSSFVWNWRCRICAPFASFQSGLLQCHCHHCWRALQCLYSITLKTRSSLVFYLYVSRVGNRSDRIITIIIINITIIMAAVPRVLVTIAPASETVTLTTMTKTGDTHPNPRWDASFSERMSSTDEVSSRFGEYLRAGSVVWMVSTRFSVDAGIRWMNVSGAGTNSNSHPPFHIAFDFCWCCCVACTRCIVACSCCRSASGWLQLNKLN